MTLVGTVVGIVMRVAASASPTLHRLSPELYDRLVDSGLLDGEPVELVDGLLVHVTPQGAEHAALVQRLTRHLGARLDLLRVQMPLAVPGGRPEPDLALAETITSRAHPRTADLVVEVALTSLTDDLAKLPGYADAGVKAVWLVDVNGRVVRVFTDPQPAERRYASERVLRTGDTLHADVTGVAPLEVGELFAVLER
jgi:Uma2 family endonuclease